MSARIRVGGLIRELGRRLALTSYAVLPKFDYAVIWGWPDHEDSVLALEDELSRRGHRVVVLMTHRQSEPPVPFGPRTWRVDKSSPLGLTAFLFARYVFFTHRCFMREFPSKVVAVNVWHGMPIKRIGLLGGGDEGIGSSHVLATSTFWSPIMARSMGGEPTVLTTGLPRNDRLFLDHEPVHRALGLEGRDDVDHLVVWLPTYRRSVRGHITVDGHPVDSPFELDGVDADELNAHLASRRAFCVVKPHPMAAFHGAQRRSNLLIVDSDGVANMRISLYQLLGAATVLVSDVSSVTIDFLLLDRPIIHAMADLDEYRDTRGFTVDNVDDLLAGPVVRSVDELLASLDDVFAHVDVDADAERRRRVRDLSHDHEDGSATRRLLAELGLSPGDSGERDLD